MPLEIACSVCGETERLSGSRLDDEITVSCGSCGQVWQRPTEPACPSCEGTDLRAIPMAIVEKGRGTQLSVVGIRVVHLCTTCDADDIERWQDNRPNPLMPVELPTVESPADGTDT